VVSNTASAAGLEWAQARGLETAVLPHRDFPDREAHDRAVIARLHGVGVDWVCLAGYMRLLSAVFVDAFPNRILNIHPALLPAFPGLHAQDQAWEWGVRISGCTVHLVDGELDHGPIVLQRPVAVAEHDTADTLSARILREEHIAYSDALRELLARRWHIEGRRVVFDATGSDDS
jgi:phosphoribosylglycinamide formyltransferase-1